MGTRLDKRGIFAWDEFLIIMKRLSTFPLFHDYQKYISVKCTPLFQASYPKLDSLIFFLVLHFHIGTCNCSLLWDGRRGGFPRYKFTRLV